MNTTEALYAHHENLHFPIHSRDHFLYAHFQRASAAFAHAKILAVRQMKTENRIFPDTYRRLVTYEAMATRLAIAINRDVRQDLADEGILW